MTIPTSLRAATHALLGALLLAGVSTLGDFIWAFYRLEHRPVYGLVHGALLCSAIGLYLGLLRGRLVHGAIGGVAIGLGAAAGFYGLAHFAGIAAMLPAWMALWIGFALLDARVLTDPPRRAPRIHTVLLRGTVAAVASGLAFYAISGIWLGGGAGSPNYALHLASWTVAFLPGFLALLVTPARPT